MSDMTISHPAPASEAIEEWIDALPAAYFEIDSKGFVTRANRLACKLVGARKESILGKEAWPMMAGSESEKCRGAYLEVMQTGIEPAPVLRSFTWGNRTFGTYRLYRSFISDEEGRRLGMRYVAVDMTDQLQSQQQAEERIAWLESAMDSLTDAVIVTDTLGFIRYLNPAAEKLTGWLSSELEEKLIEVGVPIISFGPCGKAKFSHSIALEGPCRSMATILDRKRYQLKVELTASPLMQEEIVTGAIFVLRLAAQAAAHP